MTTHLLIVLLATIAAVTYLGSRVLSLIPQPVDPDPWQDDPSDVNEAHGEQDSDDSDDETVTCGSMAEARALVAVHRQPGDEVVIHEAGCGENDGYDCDCEPDAFTVGEKAEA